MSSAVVPINVFSVAKEQKAKFVKMWTEALESIENEPGFLAASHKSLAPKARFPYIEAIFHAS